MGQSFYRNYSDYLSERFDHKIQKLTVNAGFTCPNRDGSKGRGGCTYCNNASFSPMLTTSNVSIRRQLERGKEFFRRKYPNMRYLAYFQSYTNTYAPIESLLAMYREALDVEDVEGIIIGTRPDCINAELIGSLAEINRFHRVIIEYGAESSHDSTLEAVNRCHTWTDTVKAVEMTHAAGIDTGLHFILGLPSETRKMIFETIEAINRLKPETVKFHQLQVIRGTRLAAEIERGTTFIHNFTIEEYIDLCCDIIDHLDPSIAIERFVSQSPDNLLIQPRWGLKNYEFTAKLNNRLQERRRERR